MYYDNRNIVPDYVSPNFEHSRFTAGDNIQIGFHILMFIENLGRRVLSITKIEISFTLICEGVSKDFKFIANTITDKGIHIKGNTVFEDTINPFVSVERIEYNGVFNKAHETTKLIRKLSDAINDSRNISNIVILFHLTGGRIIQPSINFNYITIHRY